MRPELKPQDPRLTKQDQKILASLLTQFAERQEFPSAGYDFLQRPPLAGSWFLIADVEQMGIQHNVTEEDVKDQKGHRVDTKFSYTTTRSLATRYFVYDPSARHLVFSGLVRSSTQATQDRIGSGHEGDYPEAPGLGKSLTENFQKFLHALPATQGN